MAKKILFLMNSMQGYAEEIVKGLKRKGYEVDWYENSSKIPKIKLSLIQRIVRSLSEDFGIERFSKKMYELEKNYYLEELKKMDKNYDFILDIGSKSSTNFMAILEEKFKSKKILFIWDDLKYDKRSGELIKCFDKIYSYCPEDSKKYNLIYRPSFYCDCFRYDLEIEKELDFFYLGHMREKDRTKIIIKFSEYLKEYKSYIKLVGGFKIRYIDRYLSYRVYKEFFIQKSFKAQELGEFCKKTKIILDITIKSQVGLGLRPIEAIGSKCKLITTNKNIKNYEFYNENNIFVLEKDFSNIGDLNPFIKSPYIEYSEEIKYKYSIDGFIEEIFGS